MRYMRYMLLLAVLAVGTWGYAYNESVAAVAFNPSLLGGYDYLKIAKEATFTGGLGVGGNKAEINIMGPVTVKDNNASSHVYATAAADPHKIKRVMSLSNYPMSGTLTFCSYDGRWVSNTYACGTASGSYESQFNASEAWLTGKQPNVWAIYNSTSIASNANSAQFATDTIQLVPRVNMYGGKLSTGWADTSNTKRGGSVIKQFAGLDLNSGSGGTINYIGSGPNQTIPLNITVYSDSDLNKGGVVEGTAADSKLYVTDYLVLAGVGIQAVDLVCSSTPTYEWIQRKTSDNRNVYMLARKGC